MEPEDAPVIDDDAPWPRPARRSARSSATRCRTPAVRTWCPAATRTPSASPAGCSTGSRTRSPTLLLEIWQPDAAGRVVSAAGSLRRDGYTFTGWGRAATDNTGRYSFTTVRPGATEGGRLPFFAMVIFARGLTNRLFTRVYLPAAPEALAADPLLGGAAGGPARHPGRRRSWRRARVRRTTAGPGRDGVPDLPRPGAVSDLYWPGDARAERPDVGPVPGRRNGPVERTWYDVLGDAGIAPAGGAALRRRPRRASATTELTDLPAARRAAGNVVIPLLGLLRARLAASRPGGGASGCTGA